MSLTLHTFPSVRGDQVHLKARAFSDLAQQKNAASYGALSEQSYSKEHFTTGCFDIVLFMCLLKKNLVKHII